MKRKKYLFKRLIRAFMALFMSFFIVIGSAFTSYNKAYAAEVLPVVAKIAQYILSSVGAVNIATNGGVSRVSGNLYDGLVQKVSDAMGNGVYVDSSGNYVFSNEFSNNVLAYLQGNSNLQYRVISDFQGPEPDGSQFVSQYYYTGWLWDNGNYLTQPVLDNYHTLLSSYNYYIFGCRVQRISNAFRRFVFYCFDASNIAFISFNNNNIYFYDNNFQTIDVNYKYFNVETNSDGNAIRSISSIHNNHSNNLVGVFAKNDPSGFNNFVNFPYMIGGNSTSNSDKYFYSVESNRSLILSLSTSAGNGVINKQSGTFISNYYIPTVKQNVVEDNDWNSIYSNYVTNVSNNYTENNTSGEFDQTLLRKWMKNYSDNIITAIQNGDTNIAEQINYLNEWMKKIYERLGMIYTLMENQNNVNSGGSASIDSPWTEQNVSDLLSGLNRIDTNMAYSLQEMQAMNTLLTNVYNWLIAHPPNSGGGGGGTPSINDDPYAPWFDTLKNMPDTDRLDIISNWDIIKGMLADIAPFAMLGIVTASLNAFSAEPVEPVFTIPLKVNNRFINIDEEVVIDFTVLDDLRAIVNALMMILGTVCYAMFCWWIIPKLYSIIV